jgi:hypothetical protein
MPSPVLLGYPKRVLSAKRSTTDAVGVDSSLVRRGFAGQESAQPRTPEFWICDRGPLSRVPCDFLLSHKDGCCRWKNVAPQLPYPLATVLSPSTTLSFLSSRAYSDFLLRGSHRRPRMWFSQREPHAADRNRNSRQEIRGSRGICCAPFGCPNLSFYNHLLSVISEMTRPPDPLSGEFMKICDQTGRVLFRRKTGTGGVTPGAFNDNVEDAAPGCFVSFVELRGGSVRLKSLRENRVDGLGTPF